MQSSGIPLGLNWGLTAAQWGTDARLDPYMAFNFAIEIEGLIVGGFSEVSGLESHIETEDYREGGVNTFVHHLPRQTLHSNLILVHGLTDISTLWNWYYEVTQGIIHRRNCTIALFDPQHIPVMWWNVRNALPIKWIGPQLKADSDAVAFESIELIHAGSTKPLLGQALALGRGAAQLAGQRGMP
jgi:phage tail-like protein